MSGRNLPIAELLAIQQEGIALIRRTPSAEIHYTVHLNFDGLGRMAQKAVGQKRWRSKDGPVTIQVRATRDLKGGA